MTGSGGCLGAMVHRLDVYDTFLLFILCFGCNFEGNEMLYFIFAYKLAEWTDYYSEQYPSWWHISERREDVVLALLILLAQSAKKVDPPMQQESNIPKSGTHRTAH
jgi:hypothetical protein